jgi:hypothetical protein
MQCSGRSTAIRGRFSDGRPRDAGQQGRRGHGWAGRHDSEWPLAVAAPFIHTRAVCATANTTPPAATRLAVGPSRGASSTLCTDMMLCAPLLQPRQAAAGPAAATPPSIPFASVNAGCCFCRQHPPLWARSTRCAVPEPVPRPPARSGWRAVAASSRILTTSRGILGHNLTASCGFTTAGAVGCQCTRPRSQHRSKPHGLADTAKQMRSSDQGRLQSR